jgi:hypothetical protein
MINLNKAQAISQDGQPRLTQQYKNKNSYYHSFKTRFNDRFWIKLESLLGKGQPELTQIKK